MAESSGNSEFVRFYAPTRIVRLYVPYPFARAVGTKQIRDLFAAVATRTAGSAYMRDDFGILDREVVAHTDTVKIVDGEVLFDCSHSAPCRIDFPYGRMTITRPGIVTEEVTGYDFVPD